MENKKVLEKKMNLLIELGNIIVKHLGLDSLDKLGDYNKLSIEVQDKIEDKINDFLETNC